MNRKRDKQQNVDPSDAMRVAASWGRRFGLYDESGDRGEPQARTKGKKLRPVCGDLVTAAPLDGESDWLIDAVLPRDNELARPDMRGRREVLAANVEMLIVVACVEPLVDWYIVDRYLAAAEQMHCEAAIVWNKSDLSPSSDELDVFASIGYPIIHTDTKSGIGIDELADIMRGKRSIFVGQSGVGKSSLINAIASDDVQRTGNISNASGEGKHTTVAATLLHLGDGIEVIDSPGVRDYAPSLKDITDAASGFVEIRETAHDCRFADCLHRAEPDCAVKAAVENGDISERRYQSYLRLVQLTRQLNQGKH
ncbi:MAG: ribosome small subunit-dependent GTPase A [Pseudomonadota bacterium]